MVGEVAVDEKVRSDLLVDSESVKKRVVLAIVIIVDHHFDEFYECRVEHTT
jgi:hypothetical protein